MFGTRRAQPVHKASLLNLPANNRDDMHKFNHVVHDIKSEFSKNIRSYNTAITGSMNRHLAQALRDAHATIDNLNRSQQVTYKAMCKIIQTQRQKVKENYQLYQQKLRDDSNFSAQSSLKIKRKVVQGTKLPPIEQVQADNSMVTEDQSPSDAKDSAKDTQKLPTPEPAVESSNDNFIEAVKEVEKGNIAVPTNNVIETTPSPIVDHSQKMIQTEPEAKPAIESQPTPAKPFLDFPSRFTNQKAFFTASLRPSLPPINEFAANEANRNAVKEEFNKESKQVLPAIETARSTYAGSTKGGMSSLSRFNDSPDNETVVSAQKAMSLRARIAEIEKQHLKDFLKKQNLERKPKPYEREGSAEHEWREIPEPQKVSKSIAAERRKLAKLRAEHRKAVLNSESCYSYTQLKNGSFLQGATSYKKKHFLPPSNRAKQQREKILKSEASRAEMNDERIGEFFTKIDLPVPKEITKKVLQKRESKKAIDLSDIKPVVIVEEPVKREKSMKPLTEVAKNVNYIRQYIRPVDRTERALRNTSWEQRY